jgi:hypothetical protein
MGGDPPDVAARVAEGGFANAIVGSGEPPRTFIGMRMRANRGDASYEHRQSNCPEEWKETGSDQTDYRPGQELQFIAPYEFRPTAAVAYLCWNSHAKEAFSVEIRQRVFHEKTESQGSHGENSNGSHFSRRSASNLNSEAIRTAATPSVRTCATSLTPKGL